MTILSTLRADLKANIDPRTRDTGAHFFKEAVKLYGVTVPTVGKIAKHHFAAVQALPKAEVWALCEELWKSGYMEETFVASQWAYELCEQYEPSDFELFELWVKKYVSNWASCDTLCNHTIGEFVMRFPDHLTRLKEWTRSDNRWVRRASAVTLIIPARRGLFLPDIFQIADTLLLDPDDLVQKGYGWMLKAASQAHQDEVFQYVMAHRATMPRTSLRYAIEKMPQGLRAQAMKK